MAKKVSRKRSALRAIPSPLSALSAKVRNAINGVRKSFNSFTDDFKLITASRDELAPKFMKAFNLWQAEVGGTFVDFCRVIVPDIPMKSRTTPDGPGYVDHPAYQAADYLRRKAGAVGRTGDGARETPTQRAQRIANQPASPSIAVARLLKTIMPLISPDQARSLFDAVRTQLNWPDRTVTRIETEAGRVEPLVTLREPRGMHAIGAMKLVMPPPPAAAAADDNVAASA
jgi:hypothetical protein